MTFARITPNDVRAELSAAIVIREYGLRATRRGSQFRLKECPRCHEKSSRDAIAIDARSGSWCHHGFERAAGGACSGDVLDLIAACEGLDCKRDFRRVMERAAAIAGVVDMSDVERDNRRREAECRAVEADEEERLSFLTSREIAATHWTVLPRHSDPGAAYLASRGLDAAAFDCVRYPSNGIAVAIHDADGKPMSVVTRQYDRKPKVLALEGSKTRGTMIDSVADVVHGRDVVIAEGVVDALTARIAWPNAVVLGANGAGKIKEVVESALARAKLAGVRLVLLPHDDEQGINAVTVAARIAVAAGFELESSLMIVDLPKNDLNASWCDGWRP